MSRWWDTLLEASWQGVPFHVQSAEGDWARRLVPHEYPGRPGANHEDLDRAPLALRIRGIIFGEDWRREREALIAAFEAGGPGPLVHPLYGTITARLANLRETVDETRARYVGFDLSFVEDQVDSLAFVVALDTPSSAAAALESSALAVETAAADLEDGA